MSNEKSWTFEYEGETILVKEVGDEYLFYRQENGQLIELDPEKIVDVSTYFFMELAGGE
jgi:hypothetical protein